MDSLNNLKKRSFYLEDFVTLKIKGNDSFSFIQNQTTNNLNSLKMKQFHFDTLLDISGKVVSSFIVIKEDNFLYFLVEKNNAKQTIERLDKYIISEDIFISYTDLKFSIIVDSVDGDYVSNNTHRCLSLTQKKYANQLTKEELTFLTGYPFVSTLDPSNQLLNNTILSKNSIDYKKGCFLGQETVSKINSRRGSLYNYFYFFSDLLVEGKIYSHKNMVGEIVLSFSFDKKNLFLCKIKRDFSVDNIQLFIDQLDKKTTFYSYPPNEQRFIEDNYNKASDLFVDGKVDLAIDNLNKIIDLYPYYEDAYESLAVILGRQEKYEEAINVLTELEKINSKSVMAQTNLSMFHMKLGNIEIAEKHKSNATINQFEAFGKQADLKRQKEEAQKQRKLEIEQRRLMYTQVLDIDEEDTLANYGLGSILLEEEKFLEAAKLFEKVLNSDKKYSVAYVGLAKSYLALEMFEDAKKVINIGIDICAKNGDLMPANELQALLGLNNI
ncbi:MAG: tetratricopeptide repeat protein [Bacteriovoracaceae bacterium]|jgi:tetratricopeptide (TPR) repeat protein|nr:tetratricopeptide repeat protein [Bacteriovoracaceae bacterium]